MFVFEKPTHQWLISDGRKPCDRSKAASGFLLKHQFLTHKIFRLLKQTQSAAKSSEAKRCLLVLKPIIWETGATTIDPVFFLQLPHTKNVIFKVVSNNSKDDQKEWERGETKPESSGNSLWLRLMLSFQSKCFQFSLNRGIPAGTKVLKIASENKKGRYSSSQKQERWFWTATGWFRISAALASSQWQGVRLDGSEEQKGATWFLVGSNSSRGRIIPIPSNFFVFRPFFSYLIVSHTSFQTISSQWQSTFSSANSNSNLTLLNFTPGGMWSLVSGWYLFDARTCQTLGKETC